MLYIYTNSKFVVDRDLLLTEEKKPALKIFPNNTERPIIFVNIKKQKKKKP